MLTSTSDLIIPVDVPVTDVSRSWLLTAIPFTSTGLNLFL